MYSFSKLRRAALIALVLVPSFAFAPAHAKDEEWGPGHAMMWGGPTRYWFGWGQSELYCGGAGTKNIDRFTRIRCQENFGRYGDNKFHYHQGSCSSR